MSVRPHIAHAAAASPGPDPIPGWSSPAPNLSGLTPSVAAPGIAKILMVDDMPANLLALEAILEPLGQHLVRAHSGEEALRQVLMHEFAAILMDVQMPGLDGFQTAALIKEREKSRHIPIVFITAISRDSENVFRGYEHGAVDYLLKPFDPNILRCKISVFVDLFLKGEEIKRQAELLRAHEREAHERERLYEMERHARREAEAATRAREDILVVVSHDLRNPLNAIFANTELLARRLPTDEGGKHARRLVASIDRSAEQMSRLVRDLLDLSRIESNRLDLDRKGHDIGSLLEQAREMLQPTAAQRQQKLEVVVEALVGSMPTPAPETTEAMPVPEVLCDKERVVQVLSNLVGNAIKFSPPASTIWLRAFPSGEFVRFSVEDSGPGIDPAELSHIFDRYWQSERSKRMGLGLGLAIAKGIVDAHEGRIWAESTPGAGSSFYFELPVFPEDSESATEGPPERPDASTETGPAIRGR